MKNWNIAKALCIGSSHELNQLPCQDALRCVETDQLCLAVVADGVGSLCNSQIAAEVAVRQAAVWFENHYSALYNPSAASMEIHSKLLPYLRHQILQTAQSDGLSPSTMDCNLAFACILPERGFAIWGVLGDGAVCVLRKDRQYVFSCVNTMIANTTQTILMDRAEDHFRLESCLLSESQLLGFMVSSDGLEGELFVKGSSQLRSNAVHYFNAMLLPTRQEREEKILDLLRRLPAAQDDDISLAVIANAQYSQPLELSAPPTWLCDCSQRNILGQGTCSRCRRNIREVYGGIDFGESPEQFFRELNRDPIREQELLRRDLPENLKQFLQIEQPTTGRRPQGNARQFLQSTEEDRSRKSRTNSPRYSKGQQMSSSKPVPPAQSTPPKVPPYAFSAWSTPAPASEPASEKLSNRPDSSAPSHAGAKFSKPITSPAEEVRPVRRRNLPMMAAVLGLVIWIVVLSASLFSANLKISRLEKQVAELAGLHETTTKYVVTQNGLPIYRLEDGQLISVTARLGQQMVITRLDKQEVTVGEKTYIHIRTDDRQEGWCDLGGLRPLDQ